MSVPKHDIGQELDADRLLSAARAAAGLSDFGDPAFLQPFHKFVEACRKEIRFSEPGLMGYEADVQRVLVNRLRMQKDLIEHPEIHDEDVSDPIFIVGMVRTGTTKLQRVMAADPGSQSIPMWQIMYPSRFPDMVAGQPDPRPEFARKAGGSYAQGPEVMAIQSAHAMMIDAPDEDVLLFENTFEHVYLYLRNPAHSYWQWLKGRSARAAYEFYKLLLKYLQWQNGGRRDRPWLLKCTTHAGELETLFDLFPNATVVHCHRDPYECIPSYSRLQELVWNLRGDPVPPRTVGGAILDIWSEAMRRCVASRIQLDKKHRIIDVPYRAINDDSLSVVRRIYAAAGRILTPQAEESMRQWERDNQQHKFGKHVYAADDFGITRELIDREFATYLGRFSAYL